MNPIFNTHLVLFVFFRFKGRHICDLTAFCACVLTFYVDTYVCACLRMGNAVMSGKLIFDVSVGDDVVWM